MSNKTHEFSENYMPKGGMPISPASFCQNLHGVKNGIKLSHWIRSGQITKEQLTQDQLQYLAKDLR